MATMTILSILMVVSFTGIAIWKMNGLPESISAMVYALPDGGWRWLWSAWLALVSILTFAPVYEEFADADEMHTICTLTSQHVLSCQQDGWDRKDAIDWEPYKALFPEQSSDVEK